MASPKPERPIDPRATDARPDPRSDAPARRFPLPEAELRAARAALIAEAERIMGVKPILGRTGPRPGY